MTLEEVFSIRELDFDGQKIYAVLDIDWNHELFSVHFPGKPILPGALMLDITGKLCRKALDKDLTVSVVSDSRFKISVVPELTGCLIVSIALSELEGGGLKAKASFFAEESGEQKAVSVISVILKEKESDICFVVPFYNNPKTVGKVIASIREAGFKVIAVDDGSTDGESLEQARKAEPLALVSYVKNKGKGYALRQGFRKALELGFKYAVVFDADGQHTIQGARSMIGKSLSLPQEERLKTVIVGSRNKRGADSGGKFANNFSNFWLTVQTGRKVGDTQSGLRLYPITELCRMNFLGNRYEFETEVLVRLAWRGFRLLEVPVDVIYPEDRVTHFRKGKDFTRISFMNTFLTLGAVFYGYPRMFIGKLFGKNSKPVS